MDSDGVPGQASGRLQPTVVEEVKGTATDYLRCADRLVPRLVTGFYVVGSAALGEYVPGRSDLDFVATVRDNVTRTEMRRLRLLHRITGARSAIIAAARGRRPTSGTPNGMFVREGEISLPVNEIRPVASDTGLRFVEGRGFDVNPVVWKVLLERGLTFRGPEPAELELDCQAQILARWNLENLDTYWRAWGRKLSAGHRGLLLSPLVKYGGPWIVAWGALGPPRLHCTIATGEVIGKRSAGEYALSTFDARWRHVVEQGLSYWRGEQVKVSPQDLCRAGDFAVAVVEAAHSCRPYDSPEDAVVEKGP
jgi:Nucleotidyltransferase domain